jgi:hypothetical protein
VTVENDGSTQDDVLPSEGEDETSEDAVVLDLDDLDQISPDEAATEHGQARAHVLEAIAGDSRGRLGELVQRAVAPQIGEANKHLGEVLAGIDWPAIDPKIFAALDGFQSPGVYKAIPESSAIATRSSALGGFAEVLGRSAADRAAFSLASGLKGSDSVSSVIGKLRAIHLSRLALRCGASVTPGPPGARAVQAGRVTPAAGRRRAGPSSAWGSR